MRGVAAVLAGLVMLAAAPSAAQERALALSQTPVAIAPADLAPGVSITGAWVLDSPDPDFGGLSGLEIAQGTLTAVTDRGHRLTARLGGDGDGPLTGARLAPLTDRQGHPLAGAWADAEGLAWLGGALFVSFERDHRIVRLEGNRTAEILRPEGAGRLAGNAGMEALAALPDGRLIALSEKRAGGSLSAWAGPPDAALAPLRVPVLSRHAVTGADAGPGGWLHVLFRHWSPETGVSIRLRAYPPGPDLDGARHVAGFEDASGIDNMEGVAAVPSPDGGLALWVVGDDNFNSGQRTVLIRLALPEPGRLQDLPRAAME